MLACLPLTYEIEVIIHEHHQFAKVISIILQPAFTG